MESVGEVENDCHNMSKSLYNIFDLLYRVADKAFFLINQNEQFYRQTSAKNNYN